jgi:hypothetical protein
MVPVGQFPMSMTFRTFMNGYEHKCDSISVREIVRVTRTRTDAHLHFTVTAAICDCLQKPMFIVM